jgi:DNA polymerase I
MRCKGTLLVVDLSNQVYKATASHQGLTSGTTFTGGLYGFLMAISSAVKETGADHILIGADARPYLRSKEYPQYKQLRKKDKSEQDELVLKAFQQSMGLVEKMLGILGIPVWRVPGFEYDDLVAHVVMKYRHRFELIVAHTNDSDIQQLLWTPGFAIFKGKKGGGIYRRKDFDVEWKGISPKDLPKALALTGTHNDIEGVHGLGPVTAIKAIKDPAKMREIRSKHGHIMDRNLPLITLPHPSFPFEAVPPLPARKGLNHRHLYKFCATYDIEVTKFMTDALDKVLT